MTRPHLTEPTIGRGHRSAETRQRMIQTAIEVFGALGFEGASTRLLAERAAVNQAAIPYHFGGKRELYLAAAQAIADHARGLIDPVVDELRDGARATAVGRIERAVTRFFHLLVGGTEPQVWISFILRCEQEADEAYQLIDGAISGFTRALTQTVAEVLECDRDDEDLRMRVTVVLAAILNFRTLRNMTLNNLGWDRLDSDRLSRLEQTIRRFALRELLAPTIDEETMAPR